MKDQSSLPPPPPPPPPPPALPAMSLGEGLPTPVTSMAKASGLHIPTAFYQALCEQEGWDVPLNFSKPHMQLEREVSVFARGHEHWESPRTTAPVAHCSVKCLSSAAVYLLALPLPLPSASWKRAASFWNAMYCASWVLIVFMQRQY